jgi:hypothetical protein
LGKIAHEDAVRQDVGEVERHVRALDDNGAIVLRDLETQASFERSGNAIATIAEPVIEETRQLVWLILAALSQEVE